MTKSSLPEGFERLARTPGEPRVNDGSPAALLIEWAGDGSDILSISAIRALVKRWTPVLRAKRAVEAMLDHQHAFIMIPKLESFAALSAELAAAGVRATSVSRDVDVRAIRERLELTQEQFALHYGLELDAVRNWEHGRRKPDTAAQSYLRAISNDPAGVEAALWGQTDPIPA